jgi:hypothetical protein
MLCITLCRTSFKKKPHTRSIQDDLYLKMVDFNLHISSIMAFGFLMLNWSSRYFDENNQFRYIWNCIGRFVEESAHYF